MPMHNTRTLLVCVGLAVAVGVSSCNSISGLNDFSVKPGSTSQTSCTTNADCVGANDAAAGAGSSAVCIKSTGYCAELLSPDCKVVTGDPSDDTSILLGSLFSTVGPQSAQNTQRQQAAQLAIEQINQVGGVPAATGAPRKLVLVSCDAYTDLHRAAKHLVNDLHVPAIVGPNTSQDTIDASNDVTAPGGTVIMSPSAIASSITSLIDHDLTWLMVPTDVQRTPLMISQINELETQLKAERGVGSIKLGVIFRSDALGIGTRVSLNDLVINGKPLGDATNLGKNVQIDSYDWTKADQPELIDKYVKFAPDIIVLSGTAEVIPSIMVPLEKAWTASTRPYYMMVDPAKTPDLLQAVAGNDAFRVRVRGTGVRPSDDSQPVYNAFQTDYKVTYNSPATLSGMGPAYDAVYSIAFALAATKDEAVSGTSVVKGLRKLTGGTTRIEVGPTKATSAFQKLASGNPIDGIGTFGPLAWDENGAVVGGTIEMWCIGTPAGTPAYQSSGLTYDIATQRKSGQYTQCER